MNAVRVEEIDEKGWASFGAAFTDRHRGWLATALRLSPRGIEQRAFELAALERVTVLTGAEPGLVCVAHAADGGPLLTLAIPRILRLFALRTDDGADLGLRAETADGGAIELRFRVPARPEAVDGIVPST